MNDTRKKIVQKAIGELGVCEPTGDDKYIQWYNTEVLKTWGLPLDAAWCAMWVSYVVNYLAAHTPRCLPTSSSLRIRNPPQKAPTRALWSM